MHRSGQIEGAKAVPPTRLRRALEGRFEIRRELGSGGMATVYLTEDLKHHRRVAVKVLRPELALALGRERFLREIEIIANLTHPHILPLHDSDVVDDVYYYVMPYVEGESLRDRLERERQLPIDEALRIAREAADALAYAHSHGVIHRDIKPHNIMLEAGHAFVTDFGIAQLAAGLGGEQLTETGVSLGTPQYMSPEQISGARLDGRSDIYALGCVLYEMLAGQPPFTGSTVFAIMARHAAEPAPGLQVVRPSVSASLEDAVMKALAKVPADRHQSAEEFARVLAEVQQQHTLSSSSSRTTAAAHGQPPAAAPAGRVDAFAARIDWTRIARVTGAGILGLAMLAAIGWLTTAVFDSQLQVPAPYAPTRSDFVILGARALILPLVYAFVGVVLVMALRYAARMLGAAITHVPRFGARARAGGQTASQHLRQTLNTASPRTVADLTFIAAFAIAVVVVFGSFPLFSAMFTSNTAFLGCANRDALHRFTPALTLLVVGIGFARHNVLRWVRSRQGDLRGVGTARWGTVALMVLLVLIMTLPWRLLWTGGNERVRIGDDRAYILRETATHLVLYNADAGSTAAHPKAAGGITRLGVQGYVFEEPEVFDSGIPECVSVRF